MNFLSNKELENIKKYCEEKKLSENLPEFLCSMDVIENALGKEWCIASTNNKFKEKGERLFDHKKKHPFSQLLGKETLESKEMSKIILFAHYLEDLSIEKSLMDKIHNYVRKEKRSEITFHEFESLFFEFQVASLYNRNELNIEFLSEINTPNPDLKINSRYGSALLECKKKRYETYSLSSVLNTIRKAKRQLEARKQSGIIAIDLSLPENIFQLKIDEILGKIQLDIRDMQWVNFVDVYNEASWPYDEKRSKVGFKKRVIENPYPKNELPREIICAVFNSQVPMFQPFISMN